MSLAIVRWIAGPVLHAVKQGPFSLRESVRVGPQALLGEVVRIHDEQIVVQVYEDTTGLRPGIEVHGDGQPLAIRLGPGFAGPHLRRPAAPLVGHRFRLRAARHAHGVGGRRHFEPGVARRRAADAGAVIGMAADVAGAAGRAQRCLAPPDVGGVVDSVVASGEYADDATVCTVRAKATAGCIETRDEPCLAGAHAAAGAPARADAGAAGHRPAHPRLPVPGGAGRQGRHPRRLRHRQDGAARGAGQGLQCRRHRLPRLRRTRQRDGRRARRVPAPSPTRAAAGR